MGRRMFVVTSLLLGMAVLPWGGGQALAQSGTAENDRAAAMERLRDRAEQVQQKRKARISHADRQAAADRAKAAREKAVGKQTPRQGEGKAGKGGAK